MKKKDQNVETLILKLNAHYNFINKDKNLVGDLLGDLDDLIQKISP